MEKQLDSLSPFDIHRGDVIVERASKKHWLILQKKGSGFWEVSCGTTKRALFADDLKYYQSYQSAHHLN